MKNGQRGRLLFPVLVILLAAVVLVAGALWVWLSVRRAADELPVLGQVPDFALVNSDGAAVRRADLDGAPWVAGFIFTTCSGICPIMSNHMARVQNGLPDESRAHLVSITVDPRHDTPEVLAAYARRFGARPGRWLFLTGESEAIYRLAGEGFHLAAGELPEWDPVMDDGPFFHSSRLSLVDAEGRIRGYYEGTEPGQVDLLQQHLARLTR
jgi:protein SCO1/2